MVICPHCGRQISEKAVYCPHCGYKQVLKRTKVKTRTPLGAIYHVVVGIVMLGVGIVLFQNNYQKVLAYQTPAGQLLMALDSGAMTKYLLSWILAIAGLIMAMYGPFKILQGVIPEELFQKYANNERAVKIVGTIAGLLVMFIIIKAYT